MTGLLAVENREYVATVPVATGLFVLRYVSSSSERPPRVFVQVSPSSTGDVNLIFIPGAPRGVLEEPKVCALVIAERDGNLQLTVAPFAGGGPNARVQLEPLSLEPSEIGEQSGDQISTSEPHEEVNPRAAYDAESTSADAAASVEMAPRSFSLTCHVSRQGDVRTPSGVWVGGPEAPAVIEGVVLDWAGKAAASIEYQTLTQGAQGRWSAWTGAGDFSGTRGHGIALVGLRIRLTGPEGDGVSLRGEAVFLGNPVVKDEGRQLDLSCLPSVDPMVGLRIDLIDHASVVGADLVSTPTPVTSDLALATAERQSLRIFRSRKSG